MLITVFCCVHHAALFINNVFDCVKKEECAVVTSSALTCLMESLQMRFIMRTGCVRGERLRSFSKRIIIVSYSWRNQTEGHCV